MRCVDIKNEIYKDGICDESSNDCTCGGLEPGKEYKIVFITTKENLPHAVSGNIENQFTSMKNCFYFKVFDYYNSYLNKL